VPPVRFRYPQQLCRRATGDGRAFINAQPGHRVKAGERVSDSHVERVVQPPPPAPELPLAPPVPRTGPPASEIAERSGITHLRYVVASGGGYGLRFFDPEGQVVEVSADVGAKPYRELQARGSVPRKISHVVINSPDVPGLMAFYERHLGFRLSDWLADRMCFLRCSAEHHNLAIAHGTVAGLNHVSFEMRGIEEYLRGTGRLVRVGYRPLWGPGRHSAGDNVYSYFADDLGDLLAYPSHRGGGQAHAVRRGRLADRVHNDRQVYLGGDGVQ
jgi:catechol 2,3-dioxygenase-like lactoylglutathione lyase family enzyme